MHHFTDLIWLALMLGILGLAMRAGNRTRFGVQLGRIAQRHPGMVLAAAGIIYTVIVLQWSTRNGRLAMDPQWDDVAYLLDAQRRLTIFDWQGLLKVIESFWKFPPHSPWSTVCALLAFMILGLHAWAPYLVNVVLVLGLLWLTCFLLSDLTLGERLVFAGVLLVLPVSVRLVQEFRPDPALAVATAAFCLGTLKLSFFAPAVADRLRTQFRLGLVAGLALLIKPSFLYHTLVIMALTQVGSALGIYLQTRRPMASRRSADRAAAFFGAAVLVSVGYYIRALPETLSYIHTNTANTPGVEIYRQHLRTLGAIIDDFLVNGEMGRMLGPFLPMAAAVIALGLIFFVRCRSWPDAGYVGSILVCALASIAILAYARLQNPYFGIFWELALVLAALHVAGRARTSGPAGRRASSVLAVIAAGTFLVHSPFAQFYPPSVDARIDQSLNRVIVLEIGRAWVDAGAGLNRPAQIQVVFGGPVNHDAQNWLARELRFPLEFWSNVEARSIEAEIRTFAAVDFVELADPASKWLYRWLPSTSLQSDILRRLRADPGFSELPAAVGREGKVYIFQRNRLP